jgi:endonuclease/exonuclease/phosphatase family metal-dependent hydrolase
MARFLLWNVQKKPLDQLILECALQERADAVFLVERPEVVAGLDAAFAFQGLLPVPSEERFRVYARPAVALREQLTAGPQPVRANLYRWAGASRLDGLIALVHSHDRIRYSDGTRGTHLASVADAVRQTERQLGHRRSVILGDFNASPFEPAVLGANGLHALGVRQLKGRADRTFVSQSADFFYNPMWRLYGHGRDAASATHYFHGYNEVEPIWHMLDQVIVRPDALDRFPESEVRIVSSVGSTSLWGVEQIPDVGVASDHLPLLFRWDL